MVPNLVILCAEPVAAPRVPASARALLRLGTGTAGRYRGPRPGEPMRGLRLVVADASRAAAALSEWGALATSREEVYLAPVTPRDRERALQKRAVLGIVAVAAVAIAVALKAR